MQQSPSAEKIPAKRPLQPSVTKKLRSTWKWLHNKPGGTWLFSRIMAFVVPYSGALKAHILELEAGHALISLTDRRSVRNHLNSIHAIALANLGEMASGLSLLMSLPDNTRGIVTKLDIEYIKKARGVLLAQGRCSLPDITGDTQVTVYADIKDSKGELVAKVSVDWQIGLVSES